MISKKKANVLVIFGTEKAFAAGVNIEELIAETLQLAQKIANKSPISTRLIKQAIQMSQNTGCKEGIQMERNMFRSLFATSFKEEGVRKFLNR